MKFLVDAQLPKRLSDFLNEVGYDSTHTLDLPNKNSTTDSKILAFVKGESRVVISKDSDFLESFLLKSEPTKLLMVKTGNISNNQLIEVFKANLSYLLKALSDHSLVEINQEEIISRG